jgi:hypothetical protein
MLCVVDNQQSRGVAIVDPTWFIFNHERRVFHQSNLPYLLEDLAMSPFF